MVMFYGFVFEILIITLVTFSWLYMNYIHETFYAVDAVNRISLFSS